MKRITIISILVSLVALAGCKKYLDVQPRGVIIPEKTSDYEGVLNSFLLLNANNTLQYLATDDVVNATPVTTFNATANIYYWRGRVDEQPTDVPNIWAQKYNNIRELNLVTSEVMNSTGGTEQQKKQLYAEAQVMKAYEYFYLMIAFSPAYDQTTAKTVYGVPIVTSVDPTAPVPDRLDLQTFVDELLAMITNSIADLPVTNVNKTRVTKEVAYGLLSKIYLYLGDYANTLKYADMVLSGGNATILNYNSYTTTTFPRTNVSPEELWYRYGAVITYQMSPDIIAKFDLAKDLRIALFSRLSGTIRQWAPGAIIPNYGVSYTEMYLNKAEVLARNGDITNALAIVNNTIRKNRFSTANYTALTATTAEQALNAVLDERRRELAFKGLRWSDMKRLDKEGRMPQVKRLSSTGAVLATLEPRDKDYTFQIPLMVQNFNPGMPLNQ